MNTMTPVTAPVVVAAPTPRARIRAFLERIELRSYLLGLVVCLVVGGGYLYFTKGSDSVEATSSVTSVTKQSIVTSISAAGKVTFSSEQQLKFNQKGTVAAVNVQQGDRVKKGEIIAELDKSSVFQDIRMAQLSLGASGLQYQQLATQKNQTITDAQNTALQAQRQVEQAQNSLTIAQQKAPTDLAAAKRSVLEKQASLAQAKLDLEKQKTTEIQNLANTAQSSLTTSDQLLDSFYDILTLDTATRPTQNDFTLPISYWLYSDITAKQLVENTYLTAINAAARMHDTYGSTLVTQQNALTIVQALADAHTLAQAVYQLGESTYAMMQGATTGTSGFTAADLSSKRSDVITNRTRAATLLNTIETAQANLSAVSSGNGIPSVTLQQKMDAVTTAEHALSLAQESMQLLQTQSPATLKVQQDSVKQMEEAAISKQQALDSTSQSTDINLSLRGNDLAQKQTSLEKLRKTLQDYELKAPFEGIITRIDYKVGDNLLDTGDTEYAVLQNPDEIVVTIPLDQVDVVHVSKGMRATVTFDAVPGQSFDGVIDNIDPTAVTQSSVVSYNVDITMPAPKGLTILSGMTTTVVIETSRKDNVLAVPNLALRMQGINQTVQKADGTSVTVQTGVTDGQYTEILSGLNEGDSVLSINIVRSGASSSTNANALRGLGGLGGGIGGPPGGGR